MKHFAAVSLYLSLFCLSQPLGAAAADFLTAGQIAKALTGKSFQAQDFSKNSTYQITFFNNGTFKRQTTVSRSVTTQFSGKWFLEEEDTLCLKSQYNSSYMKTVKVKGKTKKKRVYRDYTDKVCGKVAAIGKTLVQYDDAGQQLISLQ